MSVVRWYTTFIFSDRRLWFLCLRPKLSGFRMMLQETILECAFHDPFPAFKNGLTAPEAGIRRGEIVRALVQLSKILIVNEGVDWLLQFAPLIAIVRQNSVLHRVIPALDLPLGLGMMDVPGFSVIQPLNQIGRDAGGAIVRRQSWPLCEIDLVQSAFGRGLIKRL